MAENKFYDICVRGRLGVWLGLLAILAIIVLATSLSKGEQTGNSDKQTAGFGQGGKTTTTTTTTPTFTTFKAVWSLDPKVVEANNLPTPPNAAYAFKNLPQVKADGWDLVHDGCKGFASVSFPGKIYAPKDPADNEYPEFFLIYDKNNRIAGMHSVVPEEEKISEYSMPSKWYREFPNIEINPKYEGKHMFVTTAYFVDPKLICEDGGSQKEIGDRLWFQSGASVKDVLIAPLEQTGADSDDFWIQNKCVKTMGLHYFSKDVSDVDPNSGCKDLTPFQLLYIEGKLSGFIFQHVAKMTGKRWETALPHALKLIMNNPAQCLLDLAGTPTDNKVKTMHVFLRGHETTCG